MSWNVLTKISRAALKSATFNRSVLKPMSLKFFALEPLMVLPCGSAAGPLQFLANRHYIVNMPVLVIPNFGADTHVTIFVPKSGVQVPVVFGIIKSEMGRPI